MSLSNEEKDRWLAMLMKVDDESSEKEFEGKIEQLEPEKAKEVGEFLSTLFATEPVANPFKKGR